jgi:valyl-tRNA synthetase
MSTTPGHDSAVGEGKVKGMRNFANKIWNAARFIKINRESSKSQITSNEQTSNTKDQIFHQKIEEVTKKVTDELERMKIGQAAETVHNEFWHWYCDECLEEVKVGKLSSEALEAGLQTFLRLIHPFMPFVTEAVWQELYEDQGLLIRADWPVIKS